MQFFSAPSRQGMVLFHEWRPLYATIHFPLIHIYLEWNPQEELTLLFLKRGCLIHKTLTEE